MINARANGFSIITTAKCSSGLSIQETCLMANLKYGLKTELYNSQDFIRTTAGKGYGIYMTGKEAFCINWNTLKGSQKTGRWILMFQTISKILKKTPVKLPTLKKQGK